MGFSRGEIRPSPPVGAFGCFPQWNCKRLRRSRLWLYFCPYLLVLPSDKRLWCWDEGVKIVV